MGEKVGGYKHQLPAGKDGEPAPLPKAVLEWEEKEKADETGEGLDGTSADDLESKYQPDAHYELDQDTDTDTAMLRHVATGDEVMLDTGVRYKLYNTTSGWCLWAGGQATPEYACDVMISVAMSEKEAVKSRRVAGSMTAGADDDDTDPESSEEPPPEEPPIWERPFLMQKGSLSLLVSPESKTQVTIKSSVKWNLVPHLNENTMKHEYILQSEPPSSDIKPKWAHRLLLGSKAVKVTDPDVLKEIESRMQSPVNPRSGLRQNQNKLTQIFVPRLPEQMTRTWKAMKKNFWEVLDGSTVLRPQLSKKESNAFWVYMKAINHALLWATDQTYLDFMPEKQECLALGSDLIAYNVPPLESMKTIRFVVDEEKCQGKALNIVLQQTHLRGMSDADCCHIKNQGEEYYASLAEGVCFDRQIDSVDIADLQLDAEQFLSESCVSKRGEFGEGVDDDEEASEPERDADGDVHMSGPGPSGGGAAGKKRQTKADLYKFFSGKGPNRMVFSFLNDRSLQLCALIITHISGSLENEYCQDLEAMQQGPIGQGVWAAERAAGTRWWHTAQDLEAMQQGPIGQGVWAAERAAGTRWWHTAKCICDATYGSDLLQQLRFRRTQEQVPLDSDLAWLKLEKETAKVAVDFGHELLCRFVWAHIPFMLNLPQAFAVYLLPEPAGRQQALGFLQPVLDAVWAAEKHWLECQSTDVDKASSMEAVFNQIGWCHHQLAREVLACMLQCGFAPDNLRCRRLAAKLFRSSSTTKNCLEDVFSHLQSMVGKGTSNKRMSDWSRYFYATTARSPRSGGMQTVLPDAQDWDAGSHTAFAMLQNFAPMFDTNSTAMPEPATEDSILWPKPSALQKKKKWKAAGPESNQKGAAAMIYLHNDAHTRWANLGNVWVFLRVDFANDVRPDFMFNYTVEAMKKNFWEVLDGSTVLRPQLSKKESNAFWVYMKAINHALLWATDQTYLDFMPEKQECLALGSDLIAYNVPPLESMKTIRFVVDEEKCQGKALNIVLQQTHLRGMSDADCCHIKNQGEEYYASLAEGVCFDRQIDSVDIADLQLDAEQFLSESCVSKRGEFGEGVDDDEEASEPERDADGDVHMSGPGPSGGGAAGKKRQTKADLYKFFSGKGPNRMVFSFLNDRSLQLCALIITHISGSLENEYCQDLEAMQQGPIGQGVWAAERAAGTRWWHTAKCICDATYGSDLLQQLRFRRTQEQVPLDSDLAWLKLEKETAKVAVDFGHELLCRFVWAHSPFMLNLPQAFAVYLLPEPAGRQQALGFLQPVLDAVWAAEKHWLECQSTDVDKASSMEAVFNQIGWCHHQLAREVLACMLQCGFAPDNLRCRRLAAKLFRSSSTTKNCLEDVFSHLQSMVGKGTSNKRMSDWSRYFYATTARSPRSGGMQTVLPDAQDWDAGSHTAFAMLQNFAPMFDTNSTAMPEPATEDSILWPKPSALQKKKKWKAAGPESNQKGAAAMIYLHNDAHTRWANLGNVWVFLRVDFANDVRPDFMFNYTVEESKCCFRHMPTDVVHPACLPPELPRGIFLRVTNLEGSNYYRVGYKISALDLVAT
ncbi:unnamed protein product [Effrenium voratum]|uniref:Uncharacterized protein n=1 Tax=Effrenium voratum TaxID=2562239 RepID=A0AA36JGB3_9DINO|nr:unnamed protein product [Effrenium voratum]